MKIKIIDDKFYVLKTSKEKWIYSNENEAIEGLRQYMLNENIKPDDLLILEVSIKENNWEITQIPWSKIAFKLVRRE